MATVAGESLDLARLRGLAASPVVPLLVLLALLVGLGAFTAWSLVLSAPIAVVVLRRNARRDVLFSAIAAILAGSALSLLATSSLPASVTALAGIVGALAVGIVLVWWWQNAGRLTGWLLTYVLIACAIVLVGTIQVDIQFAKLNAFSAAVYAWFRAWPRLDNVGFSQNATAALIVATYPFAWSLAVRPGNRLRRAVGLAASAWLLFALILTLSRGAYIGLSIGLGTMLWLAGGRRRWLAPLLPGGTLILLLMGVTGYEFTLSTTPTGWSSVDRLYIWHTAARVLADFPLTGPGAGTFPLRVPLYSWPADGRLIPHAHNFVLQTYLDSGLLGLLGLAMLGIATFVLVRRLLSRPLSPPLRLATLAGAGALMGICADGSVDAYFWGDARTFYVVAIPLAVLVAVWRLSAPPGQPVDRPVWPWFGPLGSVRRLAWRATLPTPRMTGAIAAALLLLVGARPVGSLAFTNAGNVLREHAEALPVGAAAEDVLLAGARVSLRLAGQLDGANGAAWQDLAEVYLDEGDAAAAALSLDHASEVGQRDALVARDTSRLLRMALAQASLTTHSLH